MRAKRGASQILFGVLPNQTVDLEGGVWRVTRWDEPVPIPIDQATLRRELIRAVKPWADLGNDGGVSSDLFSNAQVQVVQVHESRGVEVERFPRLWRCRRCNRIVRSSNQECRCGSASFAQLQFVAFHKCGKLMEPYIRQCSIHKQVAVQLPGTATARELYFYCPVCKTQIHRGFPYLQCQCDWDEPIDVNVHRAAIVFSPHYTVLVNPLDPAEAARFGASGGGARALDWVLDGLSADGPGDGKQTAQGLEEMLIQQGLSAEFARRMAENALERGEVSQGATKSRLDLPEEVRTRAQDEATSLMSALERGRVRIQDLIDGSDPPLKSLYETAYQFKLRNAGLANVELLTDFPVTTLAFGFTRGGGDASESTLVAFRERDVIRAYGLQAHTEAILFQLDPINVANHLRLCGFDIPTTPDSKTARIELLKAVDIPSPNETDPHPLGEAVLTLVHSYAHRLIRFLSSEAGIERDGLAEYLLPHHLSFIVYASARGDFVLGGLQSIFETALDRALDSFATGETRCPLDPGCRSGGGACMACLHLGEPSCRWFNKFLDRSVLFGETGFVSMANQ